MKVGKNFRGKNENLYYCIVEPEIDRTICLGVVSDSETNAKSKLVTIFPESKYYVLGLASQSEMKNINNQII